MRLLSRPHPSPALIAAALALTIAIAGTAIAGPDAITSALTTSKVKKIAKKQANKQIKKKLGPVPVTTLDLKPGWDPIGSDSGPTPAIGWRDQLGVVHLSGLIGRASGIDNVALRLPPELRPDVDQELPAVCDVPGISFDPRPGAVFIRATTDVNYDSGDIVAINTSDAYCTERLSLDGITFRAAD